MVWLIMLVPSALTAYWWATYSGLYRLLAEMELQSFGAYYPTYTGLFTWFISLIPAVIAIQIIGGIRERERSPQEAAARAIDHKLQSERFSNWILRRQRRLTGLGLTLGLAGTGIYFSASALAGARVSVDAGALERGEKPAGRFAELAGRFIADDAVSVREGSHGEKVYLPVVSPEWQAGRPVRAYLEMYGSSVEAYASDLATEHYEGMLTANSLPGAVITSLAERGHPAPDRYWVLEYRQTPAKQSGLASAMYGAAAIIGLITAIGWAIAARRERGRGVNV